MAEWMLFDSPAINASGDALAIASKVDGVVLVVLSDKTRREVAQSAVRRLEAARAKVLGVVLNRRKMPIPEWIYKRL
jgi:Mrp family chromosome partitioning ATPase